MNTVTHTDTFDNSFPYVLVSSISATLVSLAAVWVWAVTTLGPVTGAWKVRESSSWPRGFALLGMQMSRRFP